MGPSNKPNLEDILEEDENDSFRTLSKKESGEISPLAQLGKLLEKQESLPKEEKKIPTHSQSEVPQKSAFIKRAPTSKLYMPTKSMIYTGPKPNELSKRDTAE